MSSSLNSAVRVVPNPMTKQMSVDSRRPNSAGPGFEARNGEMRWTVHGDGITGEREGLTGGRDGGGGGRGGGGGKVLREGRGAVSEGGESVSRGGREGGSRERRPGTGGGERGGGGDGEGERIIGGGVGPGREQFEECRDGQFEGGGGGGGRRGGGAISGVRGEMFGGVFGGAGGGLGSETGRDGSISDLWMRSDSLYSPPVSPVPWLTDYPSFIHAGKSSSEQGEQRPRKNGAMSEERERVRSRDGVSAKPPINPDSLRTLNAIAKSVQLATPRVGIRRTSSLGRIPDDLEEEEEESEEEEVEVEREGVERRDTEVGTDQRSIKGSTAAPPHLNVRRFRRQAICNVSLTSPAGHPSSVSSVLTDEITYEADDRDDRKPGSVRGAASTPAAPRRKKSSADLGVHYPGDLLSQAPPRRADRPLFTRNTIANFANTKAYQTSTASLISEQDKKGKSSFSLLKLIDKKSYRSKEVVASDLTEALMGLRRMKIPDTKLERFKRAQWTDLVSDEDRGQLDDLCKAEMSRRSAAWELFTSECVFLIDHLLVLKHCFVEPLKQLQVEGHLMFVEPQNLFGNLDQICSVTYCFCVGFSRMLLDDIHLRGNFCRTEVLIDGLKQLSVLSRDGEVYHDYCLNYSKALTYLELLRRNDDFLEFEKWCELDGRCNRLLLTDLLISPMQHCTKVPLLLNSICRYTQNAAERKLLMESLKKLESSLRDLDEKMKWLKSFERIQVIQQQIVWQPVTEFEPRIFIPECLRSLLNRQPCERILSNPNRQLLHEGPVHLLEAVTRPLEMYLFLFDDILLLTRIKKQPKKKAIAGGDTSHYSPTNQWTDGASLVVHRQPIALDRLKVHDLRPSTGDTQGSASCPRNAFVVVQFTRFQQIVSVYTLQSPSSEAKMTWLNRIRDSKDKFRKTLDWNSQPKTTTATSAQRHANNDDDNNEDNNEDNSNASNDIDNDRMSNSSADDLRSALPATTTSSLSSSSPLRSPLCRRAPLHHHSSSRQHRLYSAMRRPRSERRHVAIPPSVGAISSDDVEVRAEDLAVQPSRSKDELERLIEDDVFSETSIGEESLELDRWMMEGEGGMVQQFEVSSMTGEASGDHDLDPWQRIEVSRSSATEEGLPVSEETERTSIYESADTIYV